MSRELATLSHLCSLQAIEELKLKSREEYSKVSRC